MTIKKQLTILIGIVILVPLSIALFFPLYHYMISNSRYLEKEYRELRIEDNVKLSQATWDEIKASINIVTPGIQIAVFYNEQILISNIPDLRSGMNLTAANFMNYIRETSSNYNYRIQTLGKNYCITFAPHREYMDPPEEPTNNDVIIASRLENDSAHGQIKRIMPTFLLIFLFFELIVIILIIKIARSISKSIIYVNNTTQEITSGNLEPKFNLKYKNKNSSNEITSLINGLEKMRLILKEEHDRRIMFIMGISHDLRTPIALIKGYTEAITDGVVNDMDAIKSSLEIIHSKTESLEAMINDLINYVKLNSSEWIRTLVKLPLKPFLEDLASTYKQTGELYKKNIITAINIDDNIKVPLDTHLTERSLQNLFTNALRYTPDGGTISFRAEQYDSFIELSIEDTGCGIPPEDQEHIFDLFYRRTNSRREKGFGIGLSIVKTVMDAMNWKISVRSQIDKGSSFIIKIPLQKNRTE